jgi:hypothetical protein
MPRLEVRCPHPCPRLVLQSNCLRLATGALWYVSSRQIHEDLGVPHFTDDSRALTATFDSKLANGGNPLVR